jgi:hypothetical protein
VIGIDQGNRSVPCRNGRCLPPIRSEESSMRHFNGVSQSHRWPTPNASRSVEAQVTSMYQIMRIRFGRPAARLGKLNDAPQPWRVSPGRFQRLMPRAAIVLSGRFTATS